MQAAQQWMHVPAAMEKLLLFATDRRYFLSVTIPLQMGKSVIRQLPG
jgi:hypothetical protein